MIAGPLSLRGLDYRATIRYANAKSRRQPVRRLRLYSFVQGVCASWSGAAVFKTAEAVRRMPVGFDSRSLRLSWGRQVWSLALIRRSNPVQFRAAPTTLYAASRLAAICLWPM